MAEEQLNLVDGMSASLRRIYQEAERLNRRMLTLKADIKSLEKPMSMSYLRRELKATENQAKLTETALKRAVRVGEKEGILSWNARYGGIQHHSMYGQKQYIKDADLIRYGQRLQDAQLRRNRMIFENGRILHGMTFDQRYQALISKKFQVPTMRNTDFSSSIYTAVGIITMFSLALRGATDAIKSFVEPQDKYTGNITRVSLTSDRTYTPTQMMDKLYDTAIRTRADSEGTISLYNRIAMSGVKASNDKILRFVETFNKTMAISGTSRQENRAVMLQLAQGMGSNRLGGDEFRSIAEQAPMFKYMLARGMGVNPGALKQMGAEGKLTADAIIKAMEKVQDQVDEIFKTAPWTIGQLLTILQNKWQKLITHQMTGYIELRNMVMNFVNWLDTADGTKFMNELVGSINMVIHGFVSLMRILTPMFNWIALHLKLVTRLSLLFANMWIASKWFAMAGGVVKSFQLITMSGVTMWSSLSKGAIAFGTVCNAVLGWISLIIGAMVLAWNVGQKIADYVQEQRDIKAESFDEEMLARNKEQAWRRYAQQQIKEQGLTYVETVSGVGTKEASDWNRTQKQYEMRNKWENEIWNPIEVDIRNKHDQWQKDNSLGKYRKTEEEKLQDQLNDMTKSFEGAMDSSKNIPMVGKVGEVGKINDKVSIDNDGIEMMKTIAERQWVMQNEVTVPQKVEVQITKEVDVSEDRIAEVLTGGTKIAVASSMRGAATT